MKQHLIVFSVLIFLFIAGCSSKKYYEPETLKGDIDYSGSLPASIVHVGRHGATLSNGQVITEAGLQEISLPENHIYIHRGGSFIITSDLCGKLALLDSQGTIQKELTFDAEIVSAAIKEDYLAILLSNNTIMLRSISEDKVLFEEKGESTFAHDSINASPLFLSDLIIFPTLDGKMVIIDANSYKSIRNIVVNSEKFFNNIIFMEVLDNRLVAATQRKIISVSPDLINTYEADIRNILFLRDTIYIQTKDGRIVKTDNDLNVKEEKKLRFAHFTGIAHGRYIYSVEKQGFLITMDPDLKSKEVYEMPSEIDSKLYATQDRIYFDDNYIELQK